MRVLSEQIKLTFKINVKSHPWYEERQACSSGRGRDVEESSPPNFWPSVHVPFYLLSPIISLLLEHICYCLITRTASRSSVGGQPGILAAVGSGSFVDCFTPRSELGQHIPPVGLWLGGRMPGVWGEGYSCTELPSASWYAHVPKPHPLIFPQPRLAPSVPGQRGGSPGIPPGQAAEQLGETCRTLGSAFSFCISRGCSSHTNFFPPSLLARRKTFKETVWAESEHHEVFPKVIALGNVYLWAEQSGLQTLWKAAFLSAWLRI